MYEIDYEEMPGGIAARRDGTLCGWILRTLNDKWTFEVVEPNRQKQPPFDSKEAAIRAFEYMIAGIL